MFVGWGLSDGMLDFEEAVVGLLNDIQDVSDCKMVLSYLFGVTSHPWNSVFGHHRHGDMLDAVRVPF